MNQDTFTGQATQLYELELESGEKAIQVMGINVNEQETIDRVIGHQNKTIRQLEAIVNRAKAQQQSLIDLLQAVGGEQGADTSSKLLTYYRKEIQAMQNAVVRDVS